MNEAINSLHLEAIEKARGFRQAEAALVDILMRIDQHKVFVALGYASLFEYCLRELKLSESHTCNFIAVARKAREIPALKAEISAGNLSVSKARKMAPVLTAANANLWLEKARTLTHKALEKEVARERPEVLVPVGSRYISSDRLALQVCISEELMEQLAQLRDLLSQRKKEPVSLETALEVVVGDYLERHDPVRKAERSLKKRAEKGQEAVDANSSAARQVEARKVPDLSSLSEMARQGLKQIIKHEVIARDRGQCTHVYANGQRCRERRFLEMHHVRPVSQGGEDTPANLVLLCSAHHKHRHLNGSRMRAMPTGAALQGHLQLGIST